MTKAAKLASQARLPDAASPPATPTRFDSAMPTLKKRSGNFLAKCSVRVELWTSPSTTTMSGSCSPEAGQGQAEGLAGGFAEFHVLYLCPTLFGSFRGIVARGTP